MNGVVKKKVLYNKIPATKSGGKVKLANHQYSNNHHSDNYFRQWILKLKCEGLPWQSSS